MTEEGKKTLRKLRHDTAVDLNEAWKKSRRAFKEGWDKREAVHQGMLDDYNKFRNSGKFTDSDKKNLDSVMDLLKNMNQEYRDKERSEYNEHLGKLLKHSKSAAKYAQRVANKIGGNGGISKTKLTPDGRITK